ncbi:2,5-diamino-6-(ribosylamino)-4(3H)-pyrimidinone 5'-phosphate reductase [Nitrososphaera viennensis]|uniref:2,5-diamino-6-(ribosylamino)-4(3H)-pyrimidinone 5'-phosphate reductase n=2 Tax=Nitrososphaera viennensis TaxID=1034015 RepID=A0A060HTN5_9ARCH|nr:2,5-diamino-6-(ribosylamino)-4(3H)-pyrimidinone 5'-phosphate reductase [Nitrososphaera viennensis]AIC16452.1 2,5-diamino-6-hydroxy-4-(5-phosphoribosylamino)pyrimidine 1-reductase, archaeal [Nitrososphaera viennensis EN76]UVS68386.1 2,5-diamino-6-(ribosylamino)-4(3H)-pyrimidinone 5'-phosphate reductase [Nitrososphaera viennensis]
MKVTINAAMTIDGKIATASGDSTISSKDDLKRVHRLRAGSDAVVVGISTVLADDPQLTVRLVRGKNPVRVVVDSRGRIPDDSQLLRTARKVRTIVAASMQASAVDVERIRQAGAEVILAGNEAVDIKALFSALKKKMGFKKILVEGGGELNWSVLNLGLADELIVTIAPRVAGGRLATTLVEGDGYDAISQGPKFRLARVQKTRAGELVLFYKVGKNT